MGKGQDLYKKAKKIIPGGTQLLSKRPEQFLPELWPAYYSKAKGCEVWDLDGNKYTDVSYMGIGACTLGYACKEVDDAVKAAIDNGGMCTLNAPEEVFLAEELLKLHPWASLVRYAKAGGEAMSVAVRIARAYTGKDKVLFCGYHGWHDWYLSANLQDKDSLNAHLLAGLEPAGVPIGLKHTNIPFKYNDFEEFRAICAENKGEVAAVVMEPVRNDMPESGFLEEIREYSAVNGIVLIFDEITAGFRLCCGGSHRTLHVAPDIAVFAKALGNGYPISAIIGVHSVMEAAQNTFISSTYWTERTGFCAALATLKFYKEHRVDEHILITGAKVKKIWTDTAEKYGIKLDIGGIDPLAHFTFADGDPMVSKTFFIQEMLKRGFLSSTSFYSSYAHTDKVIDEYAAAVNEVFSLYKNTPDIKAALKGPVCQSGFQRLN